MLKSSSSSNKRADARARSPRGTGKARQLRQVEEALRRSQAVLAQAGQIARLGAWDIEILNRDDLHANPLRWSDEVYRIFGYEPGGVEVTNALFFERVHPDDRPRILEAVARATVEKRPYMIEHRIVRPDGAERTVIEHAEISFDEQGLPCRMIGAVQDITERKRAEEALRRSEQRFRALADELARSNMDLEQFASMVSHDLQQPLVVIGAYLDLLRRKLGGKLDAETGRLLDVPIQTTRSMEQMVRGMLDYSRVGSQGKPFERVALEGALHQTLATLGEQLASCGGVLIHDPLPTVRGDPFQIAQLFQNLLGNAIKFRSPERRLRIHVGARSEAGAWTVRVDDNGIGMDPSGRERLFEMFQRLHAKQEFPGAGIGLAICKKIIQRHGGRIWVESEPGKGSTFFFTFPAE